MCAGICHVLAALPENQRIRSFHALALPALDCFDKMTTIANAAFAESKSQEEIDIILARVADEIHIFTGMSRTFTNACFAHDGSTETAIPTPLLVIIRKVWPSIVHTAATYSNDEVRHFWQASVFIDAGELTFTSFTSESFQGTRPISRRVPPSKMQQQ